MIRVRAAFDVSKEHPRGVTAIGGYIAGDAKWEHVEALWRAELARASLAAFHLHEIKHDFRKNWTEVVTPFAKATREAGLRSVTALLKDTDWAQMDHRREYKKVCPHREHACLDMLFGVLAEDMDLHFKGQPLAIVFDNDYGNPRATKKAVRRIHDAWKERSGHEGFEIFFKGEVSWGDVPLQCGDMLAGLVRLSPLSHATLNNDYRGLDDNDRVAGVASMALSNGRGTMWSLALAAEVEAALQRRAASQAPSREPEPKE